MPTVSVPVASTVELVRETVPGAELKATPAPPPDVVTLEPLPITVPFESTRMPNELVPVVVMVLLMMLAKPPLAASTPVAPLPEVTLMVVPVLLIVPPNANKPAFGVPPLVV